MAAIPMKELVVLEKTFGLSEDGLTYPQRLARINKVQKGEEYNPADNKEPVKRGTIEPQKSKLNPIEAMKRHPLYNRRVLITPLMVPDKNRNLYYDEPVGHDIRVEEISAGAELANAVPGQLDRVVTDYRIVSENKSRVITAKTTLPKSGQEISWLIGKEIVPVVRGNDGQRGYIWQMTPHMHQIGDTMIQVFGLKTLITQIAPELLPRFKDKPVMMYIDGLVLAASIPLTDAILKEHRRKEIQDAKLGLV